MQIIIDQNYDGLLLREFLRQQLRLSTAQITRLKKKENGLTVNERHVTVRYVLKNGDTLNIDISDDATPQNIVPFDAPIDIIYEDEDIIAINKPHGMPTHPSHGHYGDTLANALVHYFNQKGTPFVFRCVNRLDKDTSGIVLCAKTAVACAELCRDMQDGKFEKTYFALINGQCANHGFIEANIKRFKESVILRCVCPEGEGKYAKTEYSKISENDGITLVELIPHTGRTHQLRVHMQSIGTPILGDVLYGNKTNIPLMLHAGVLKIPHPSTKETVTLHAPLPERFNPFI